MALTPLFTSSQTVGLPNIITITDTSTGSDVLVTQRRVYLIKQDGTYLVPVGTTTSYIVWDYADVSIDIDALDKDYCLNVKVDWLNVSNAVLYTKTSLTLFSLYNKTFYYSLTQFQAANFAVTQDTNYYNNKAKLWTFIISAENAVSIGGDIGNSQLAIDSATHLTDNENLFF
jgi:hypothetical protein